MKTLIRWVGLFPIVYLAMAVLGFGFFLIFGFINNLAGFPIASQYIFSAVSFCTAYTVVQIGYALAPKYKIFVVLLVYLFGAYFAYSSYLSPSALIELNEGIVFYSALLGGFLSMIYCLNNYIKLNPEIKKTYLYRLLLSKIRIKA